MTRNKHSEMKITREAYVDTGDAKLFVRQAGSQGSDIVVVHGGTDWDHSYLLPIAQGLQDRFRFTFFDIRGCGRSEMAEGRCAYSLAAIVRDLSILIKELRLTNPILLGFSFGGRVAMEFAASNKDSIGALILASTTAYDDWDEELRSWDEFVQRYGPERRKADKDLLGDQTIPYAERNREFIRRNLDLDVYDLTHVPAAMNATSNMLSTGKWLEAWLTGGMAIKPHRPLHLALRQVKAPILIIHGEKDMRFPVSVANRLHAELRQSSLCVLHSCGHLAYLEKPQEWRSAVLDFLSHRDA